MIGGELLLGAVNVCLAALLFSMSYRIRRRHFNRWYTLIFMLTVVSYSWWLLYRFGNTQAFWAFPVGISAFYLMRRNDALIINGVNLIAVFVIGSFTVSEFFLFNFGYLLMVIFTLHMLKLTQLKMAFVLERSKRDALTGIWSRSTLESDLQQSINQYKKDASIHTLLFIDVDHFKLLNDQLGHVVGDRCLMDVAGLISELLPLSGKLYRYGGDEFCVLIKEKKCVAMPLATMITNRVKCKPFLRGHPLEVSVGVAEIKSGDTPTLWIERADKAMYYVKRSKHQCEEA
jgi:diguanylate cyclase (GGDEF)-like protein